MTRPETSFDCKVGQSPTEDALCPLLPAVGPGLADSKVSPWGFRPLLAGFDATMLNEEPFPMLVVENALPSELYEALRSSLPGYLENAGIFNCIRPALGLDHYPEGHPASLRDDLPDNTKMARRAFELLADPALPKVWGEFVRVNTGQEALQSMLHVFGKALLREHPDFEQRFGALSDLQAVQRYTRQLQSNEVELDTPLLLHTPVKGVVSQQRGPHLKTLDKPIEGFLYLAPVGFDGPEAVHEFFAVEEGAEPLFGAGLQTESKGLRLARTVPVRGNTLVIFLNTARSIQTIAPRSTTPFPLIAVEVLMQMQAPLFQVPRRPSQDSPTTAQASAATGSSSLQPATHFQIDQPFAGAGWYAPERDATGPFRWTGPTCESYVDLHWDGAGDGLLRCHVRHAISDKALETLKIQVQDHTPVVKRRLHEGGIQLEAVIPREVLENSQGRVRVHFHVPETARASHVSGGGGVDSRPLGIGIASLSIVPHIRKPKGDRKKQVVAEGDNAASVGSSSAEAAKMPGDAKTQSRLGKGFKKLMRLFGGGNGR
ncbi:hypothetical protein [Verrucomicrobium sp. BvORR034]|uniref:hypothetical protein n=1 Tax=Verrucomicrobium sp. BvORR034 TaxID=1396418 RepID=UPI000AF80D94|nr:hypothetical protein [Verrucomicrobium sp. BvORR034]